MFKRYLEDQIIDGLDDPEVVIINGPRRVGKTTLLHALEKQILDRQTVYFDFTDPKVIALWQDFSKLKIDSILEDLGLKRKKGVLFFDETQFFNNMGLLFKLFYDYFTNIKIIATGSSSFLLLQNIGDSLAGRKKILTLYPLSLEEITHIAPKNYWAFAEKPVSGESLTETLKKNLLFGAYPEIYLAADMAQKVEKLKEISESYLFKDLLMIETVKKPRLIVDLTQLLAYQVGNLVNPHEIAQDLGISRETVLHYLDLLEKFFIFFRLYPYERNLRDVVKKKFKIYFYDLGIRNALIGDFSPIENRSDKGFLLENAVVLGLKRRIDYEKRLYQLFFWRNYDGREVDIVLKNQQLSGFEVKWSEKKKKTPKSFPGKGSVITFADSYRLCF